MQTSDVSTDEARPFLFSIHIALSLRLIVLHLVARGLLRASAHGLPVARNDGFASGNPRPPSAGRHVRRTVRASLRGTSGGIAGRGPKQSPCNGKRNTMTCAWCDGTEQAPGVGRKAYFNYCFLTWTIISGCRATVTSV